MLAVDRADLGPGAEHHVAAAERVAANIAEAQAQKGVRGTARRVRKALTGKQAPTKKGKK